MEPKQLIRPVGIVVAAVCGLSLWSLAAGPSPTGSATPSAEPAPEWREKFQVELRDHPRLARSIIALHETKDYLEKNPNTFGGHKAAAIASCDAAILELKNALQFDAKQAPRTPPASGATPAPRNAGGSLTGTSK